MDTKTVKQINQIDAKRQLCLPLTAEEEALFELYGIPRIMQVQPASTRDRLDEVKKKAVFVEYYLSPLLRAADLSITDAKYNFYPETNEEIVTVTYKNNFTRNVYVTADSFRAIITDVMAQVYTRRKSLCVRILFKSKLGGADMQKLVELKKVVYAELVENEQARRNDMELLLGVFKRLGIDTRKSFAELANSGKLRQMESITRCRRKLQQEYPELRIEPVAKLRNERQQVFKDFAKVKA